MAESLYQLQPKNFDMSCSGLLEILHVELMNNVLIMEQEMYRTIHKVAWKIQGRISSERRHTHNGGL
jgi:hypothetical protein